MRKKHFILTTSLFALSAVNATDWVAGAGGKLTQDRSTKAEDTFAGVVESGYKTLRTNAVAFVKGNLGAPLTAEEYTLQVDSAEKTITRAALLSTVETFIDSALEALLGGYDFDPNHPAWKDKGLKETIIKGGNVTALNTLLNIALNPESDVEVFNDSDVLKTVKVKGENDTYTKNRLIETLYNLHADKTLAHQLKRTINLKKLSETIDGPEMPEGSKGPEDLESPKPTPRDAVLDLFLDNGWGIYKDKNGKLKDSWPDLSDKEVLKQLLGNAFFEGPSTLHVRRVFQQIFREATPSLSSSSVIDSDADDDSEPKADAKIADTSYYYKEFGKQHKALADAVAKGYKVFVEFEKWALELIKGGITKKGGYGFQDYLLSDDIDHAAYKKAAATLVDEFLKFLGSSFDKLYQTLIDDFEANLTAELKRIVPGIDTKSTLTETEIATILDQIDEVESFTLHFYQDIFETVEAQWVKAKDTPDLTAQKALYKNHGIPLINTPWVDNYTRLLLKEDKLKLADENNHSTPQGELLVNLNINYEIDPDNPSYEGLKIDALSELERQEHNTHVRKIENILLSNRLELDHLHAFTAQQTFFFGDESEPGSLATMLKSFYKANLGFSEHFSTPEIKNKINKLNQIAAYLLKKIAKIPNNFGSNKEGLQEAREFLEQLQQAKELFQDITVIEVAEGARRQISLEKMNNLLEFYNTIGFLPDIEQYYPSVDPAQQTAYYEDQLDYELFKIDIWDKIDALKKATLEISTYIKQSVINPKLQRTVLKKFGPLPQNISPERWKKLIENSGNADKSLKGKELLSEFLVDLSADKRIDLRYLNDELGIIATGPNVSERFKDPFSVPQLQQTIQETWASLQKSLEDFAKYKEFSIFSVQAEPSYPALELTILEDPTLREQLGSVISKDNLYKGLIKLGALVFSYNVINKTKPSKDLIVNTKWDATNKNHKKAASLLTPRIIKPKWFLNPPAVSIDKEGQRYYKIPDELLTQHDLAAFYAINYLAQKYNLWGKALKFWTLSKSGKRYSQRLILYPFRASLENWKMIEKENTNKDKFPPNFILKEEG